VTRLLVLSGAVAALVLPAASPASTSRWTLRTPGGFVYCRMEIKNNLFDAFTCCTNRPLSGGWAVQNV
jgi:hypothetical protein